MAGLLGDVRWEYNKSTKGGSKMVRDQDGVDRASLATPEDENSVQQEESAEEQEPLADEDEDEDENEDEEDSEYYLHRLEKLLRLDESSHLPNLDPHAAFGRVALDRTINVNKKEFDQRLRRFFKTETRNVPPPSSELVDFLFDKAINAHKRIAAWDFIVRNTKSAKLRKTRQHLRQELNRYVKIQSLLKEGTQKTPSWMSAWAECWVGAFEEILGQIVCELRTVEYVLDQMSGLKTSASIEIESYILWVEKNNIHKQLEGTEFARKLEQVIAGFAYAAKLVMPKASGGARGYVASIKQRVSRVSRSKEKHMEALTVLFRTYLLTETE
jgi:hypothetical protein